MELGGVPAPTDTLPITDTPILPTRVRIINSIFGLFRTPPTTDTGIIQPGLLGDYVRSVRPRIFAGGRGKTVQGLLGTGAVAVAGGV